MSTISNSNFSQGKQKSAASVLMIVVVLWIVIQALFAVPDSIVDDWLGWRQADTQTIARNFLSSDLNIFYPQINWGGTGPGYLECEFQLYTFFIASIMKISGEAVWPGQLLSLLFISLTTFIIFLTLNHRFKNQYAALTGAVFFLVSNGSVHLSTAVIPDSLCILFYSLGLYTFLKYLDNKKTSSLLLFILFTTSAALIKPLALNLGIIQFFILMFGYRHLLKSPKIWAAWILIISITGSYLLFSNGLFKEYGNTFGVLGGDSKFPTLKGLIVLLHYPKLLYMTILWGLGPIGFISAIYLIFKRKLSVIEWSLIIGNAAAILIPMRYTVNQGFSPHYYIFAALLGSWFIAQMFIIINEKFSGRSFSKFFPLGTAVVILFVYSFHLYSRMHPLKIHYDPEVTRVGYKLKQIAEPGSLAIIRSIADERERSEWGDRINNFEDPRIFYIADIKGWALPNDDKGSGLIEKYTKLGADYYVEPFSRKGDKERYDWLDKHGKLMFESDYGRIYKIFYSE